MNPAVLAEPGALPDAVVRFGIRRRLLGILKSLGSEEGSLSERKGRFVSGLRKGAPAIEQDRVNRQHYGLPPEFFDPFPGYRRKYSCCFWPDGGGDLDPAEEAMLEITASRAGMANGQRVLDPGCGWGSFSLRVAGKYPETKIHALSNSKPRVEPILSEAGFKKKAP